MEWINCIMDHSTITIIFLALCLLILNFGAVLWVVIIGALLFALSKII